MTWKSLRHENVLPLVGVTMSENRFEMVSEWMPNGSINEFVKVHKGVNRFELVSFHRNVSQSSSYSYSLRVPFGD